MASSTMYAEVAVVAKWTIMSMMSSEELTSPFDDVRDEVAVKLLNWSSSKH